MPLNLAQKQKMVREVQGYLQKAISIVAADYRGLTSAEVARFRAKARVAGVMIKVVRNSLVQIALTDTSYAGLSDKLVGPIILGFAQNEPGAGAKVFRDFAKENENLKVVAVALDGNVYGAEQLEAIASMPSRDEALGQLLGVLQAPIAKFVRTLSAPVTKLVRTIVAVQETKG
jgi:large subunit ribosomal protein L10